MLALGSWWMCAKARSASSGNALAGAPQLRSKKILCIVSALRPAGPLGGATGGAFLCNFGGFFCSTPSLFGSLSVEQNKVRESSVDRRHLTGEGSPLHTRSTHACHARGTSSDLFHFLLALALHDRSTVHGVAVALVIRVDSEPSATGRALLKQHASSIGCERGVGLCRQHVAYPDLVKPFSSVLTRVLD